MSVSCEASVDVVDLLTSSSSFSFSVYSTLLYLFPGHTVLLIEATGQRTRQTGEGKSVQVLSIQLILFEGERERRRTNTDFLSPSESVQFGRVASQLASPFNRQSEDDAFVLSWTACEVVPSCVCVRAFTGRCTVRPKCAWAVKLDGGGGGGAIVAVSP